MGTASYNLMLNLQVCLFVGLPHPTLLLKRRPEFKRERCEGFQRATLII